MSLSYDLTAVKNHRSIDKNTKVSLIWACMAVGLHAITEENVDEFFRRLRIIEGVRPKPPRLTPKADVVAMIGLKTNALPDLTEAEFNRHVRKLQEHAAELTDAQCGEP
jgi:hypothetical protein